MEIIENLYNRFHSPCLSLSLWSLSGSLAVRALETIPPNPELPFLLASKIFIRTIRSSDKASTEGRGSERQRRQDVPAGRLFCNTLYPDHRPVLVHLRHSGHPLCPQPEEGGTVPARSPPPPPHPIPSRPGSVLAPGQEGSAAQHAQCVWGAGGVGGGTRASGLLRGLTHRRRCARRSHFRHSARKVVEERRGWTQGRGGSKDL